MNWLLQIGSGFIMDNPSFAHQWLFDWLERGVFAKAAFDGYVFAPHTGTKDILKHIKL